MKHGESKKKIKDISKKVEKKHNLFAIDSI